MRDAKKVLNLKITANGVTVVKASKTIRMLFRCFVKDMTDTVAMLALADELESEQLLDMAMAYRWAAEHGKRPFLRRRFRFLPTIKKEQYKKDWMVYDWDTDRRECVPVESRLPEELYRILCKVSKNSPTRMYGGVNRAFIWLVRALKECGTL